LASQKLRDQRCCFVALFVECETGLRWRSGLPLTQTIATKATAFG
jgi:hypothetical protein